MIRRRIHGQRPWPMCRQTRGQRRLYAETAAWVMAPMTLAARLPQAIDFTCDEWHAKLVGFVSNSGRNDDAII